VRETFAFLGQAVTRFRSTGAVVPSSRRLARAMANEVGALPPEAVIVELGPGTGVFTRELVHRFPDHRIVAVEFNHQFAAALRASLPRVAVVEGCASQLPDHLRRLGIDPAKVHAVVSGLPLLSLPRDLGDRIMGAIRDTLPPGGRYVQFTYAKAPWRTRQPPGFAQAKARRVWVNLPPAVVLPFERV
jgi:phosphatidylethanolamine/phosphatidyl-N-methylethanolamine N-methyltransferase